MNRTLLFSLISFVCGVAAAAFYFSRQHSAAEESLRAKVAVLEDKLATSAAKKGSESSAVAAGSGASGAKPAAVQSGGPGMVHFGAAEATPESMKAAADWREKMRKGREERQKLKVDERLAALRGRLNLTAEQAEALRPLLARMLVSRAGIDVMGIEPDETGKVEWSVEKMKERQQKVQADRDAAEQEMLASLTPEQRQAYQQWKEEDRANKVEMRANQELAALQSQLTLSAEQKDKAFAAFSNLAAAEGETDGGPLGDPANFMKRREQRIAAMKEILTPEQQAVYERNAGTGLINVNIDGGDGLFIGGDVISGGGAAASVSTIISVEDGAAAPDKAPPAPPAPETAPK